MTGCAAFCKSFSVSLFRALPRAVRGACHSHARLPLSPASPARTKGGGAWQKSGRRLLLYLPPFEVVCVANGSLRAATEGSSRYFAHRAECTGDRREKQGPCERYNNRLARCTPEAYLPPLAAGARKTGTQRRPEKQRRPRLSKSRDGLLRRSKTAFPSAQLAATAAACRRRTAPKVVPRRLRSDRPSLFSLFIPRFPDCSYRLCPC